ncbi:hypothetical protein PIB30_096885 [Stylosanthes scabra]|uniref:Uncharacterized protein n=1 Tax=Stylosanthes scabra TaxID=79078 RepID=A0ABU6VWF4_9FABA|nr:hypothetical protein [Stylosanthes scabra]
MPRSRLGHVWGVLGRDNEAVSRLSHAETWFQRGAPSQLFSITFPGAPPSFLVFSVTGAPFSIPPPPP